MISAPGADAVLLDLSGILQLLAGYLHTDLGRSHLDHLEFITDIEQLQWLHELLNEASDFASAGGSFRFGGVSDPAPLLARAAIEGVALEAREILELISFLDRANDLRQLFKFLPSQVSAALSASGRMEGLPRLAELAARIPDLANLLRALTGRILPNGDLDDSASPALSRLRREIERQRRAIEASLQSQVRKLGSEEVLQEELITIRGERFVLPVKTELRRRVAGVVHGASSSGQTVYIEPLETIELNNELVRLLEDEQAEVRRILAEMTVALREHVLEVRAAAEAFGELEFHLAKGNFARDFHARSVEFTSGAQPELELRNARHPLLMATLRAQGKEQVPLTIALQQDRVLIISGPNTGGKTVALKTIGAAAWMAQAGLPVSADVARLPVFDRVLVDIGDAQSIRESLSTFSSHLVNIRRILSDATRESLVILDELGAATDPAEGAALAIAIVEFLKNRGPLTLISTHHGALKTYASTEPGCINASVGFDRDTLRPTYEFRVGVPGISAGLDIAQRLGLQQEIVAAARQRMSPQDIRANEFLTRLQQQVLEAERLREHLSAKLLEVQRKEEKLDNEERRERKRKLNDMEKRFEELLRQFEVKLRAEAAHLGEKANQSKLERDAQRAAARLRREAQEAFQSEVVQHLAGIPQEQNPSIRPPASVRVGERVRLRNFDRVAKVLRRDGDKLEIEMGNIRLRVMLADVLEVLGEAGSAAGMTAALRPSGVRLTTAAVDAAQAREINLIGETADEATRRLEKFLDNALLAELPQVRIVHGAGSGVLRRAVADLLKQNPNIEKYYHPPQNQGGSGVTIAEMKT